MKRFSKEKEIKKLNLKQNKDKYIKYTTIGISCLILVAGVILFAFAYFESKSPDYTLINGTVSSSGDVNIIAIYKGDQKVDEIPAKGSGWKFRKAECTNGASASWNINDWNLSITFNGKTKCSVYFSEVSRTAVEYINDLGPTTDQLLNDNTSDNNLRYVGANPNNYVRFNNELWQILGIMNNIKTDSGETQSLLKIRRTDSLGYFSWDTSASGLNGGYGVNEWSQSDLMRELNNDYLGSVLIGTDGNWYSYLNDAKSNSKPNSTINSAAQSMIENVVWKLGSPNNNAGSFDSDWQNTTASKTYIRERSNYTGKVCTSGDYCNDAVVRATSWTGKVGLIYPSDFLYATSGGNAINRSTCLGLKIYNEWSSSTYKDCPNNDWMFNSHFQWTLSTFADPYGAYRVVYITSNGNVSDYYGAVSYGVHPVVFLKSSVSITGGTGTQADPYTLG